MADLLERTWKYALDEDRVNLIPALYDLAPDVLKRVVEAAQLLDQEAQDVLEAIERAEASAE